MSKPIRRALGCAGPLGLAALIGLASPALAQTTDWTGPYGGLTLGATRSDGEAERSFVEGAILEVDVANGLFPDEIDDGETGVIGGVMAGYLFQRPGSALVGGVEADLSVLDLDQTIGFSRVDPEIFVGADTNSTYTSELDALATLRLRAGYAAGDTLLYVTGGAAAGRAENDLSIAIPAVGFATESFSQDDVIWGYAVGAGIERRTASGLRVRAEALYYDLEDVTIEATDEAAFPGQQIDYEFANDGVVLRAGVVFPF